MNIASSTILIDGNRYRLEDIPNRQLALTKNDNIVLLEDFKENGEVIFSKEKIYKPFNIYSSDARLTIVVESKPGVTRANTISTCPWKKAVKVE